MYEYQNASIAAGALEMIRSYQNNSIDPVNVLADEDAVVALSLDPA